MVDFAKALRDIRAREQQGGGLMDDSMSDGLESVWEGDGMTQEEVKAASEGNLIPKGRWEGQLEPFDPEQHVQVVQTERGDHPLEGKKVARLHAKLYTDEGEKHMFFDAYPSVVKATSKSGGTYTRAESEHAAFLYQATKMMGRPFGEVIKFAENNRLVYDIGVKKAREDKETGEFYKAANQLRGIYGVKKEA